MEQRSALYATARVKNPLRWKRAVRDRRRITIVYLNTDQINGKGGANTAREFPTEKGGLRNIIYATSTLTTCDTGMNLVFLQKEPSSTQLRNMSSRNHVLDLSGALDCGAEALIGTAAVMASLDLVISTDTSIAHLAWALGRPVRVAVSARPDWRWLGEREDSPWYSAMRLFRPSTASSNPSWETVVTNLVAALTLLTDTRK